MDGSSHLAASHDGERLVVEARARQAWALVSRGAAAISLPEWSRVERLLQSSPPPAAGTGARAYSLRFGWAAFEWLAINLGCADILGQSEVLPRLVGCLARPDSPSRPRRRSLLPAFHLYLWRTPPSDYHSLISEGGILIRYQMQQEQCPATDLAVSMSIR